MNKDSLIMYLEWLMYLAITALGYWAVTNFAMMAHYLVSALWAEFLVFVGVATFYLAAALACVHAGYVSRQAYHERRRKKAAERRHMASYDRAVRRYNWDNPLP